MYRKSERKNRKNYFEEIDQLKNLSFKTLKDIQVNFFSFFLSYVDLICPRFFEGKRILKLAKEKYHQSAEPATLYAENGG